MNLSDAEQVSFRRLTIRRQLFVFGSPSEATDNQLAGQRSKDIVLLFVSHSRAKRASVRRSMIRRSCDCSLFRHQVPNGDQPRDRLQARMCDCVLCSRSWAKRASGRRTMIRRIVFAVHCSGIKRQTAINRATDFKPKCVIVFCVRDHGPNEHQVAGR